MAVDVVSEVHFAMRSAGLDPANFTTKMFRRGGATGLAFMGATGEQIQKLGRWSSKASDLICRPFLRLPRMLARDQVNSGK